MKILQKYLSLFLTKLLKFIVLIAHADVNARTPTSTTHTDAKAMKRGHARRIAKDACPGFTMAKL